MEFSTYNNHLTSQTVKTVLYGSYLEELYVGRQAPDFNPFKNNKENEKPLKESKFFIETTKISRRNQTKGNTKDKSVYINSLSLKNV
jgi:hypothetical protein